MSSSNKNTVILEKELSWFRAVLEKRIHDYFNPDNKAGTSVPVAPELNGGNSWYESFICKHSFSESERIILMLGLAPEVRPQLLDILFSKNKLFDRGFTEFGGILGQRHSGFIPTVQTAYFILAGDDLAPHFEVTGFFEPFHAFRKNNIFDLDIKNNNEPFTSTPLRLSKDTLSLFTKGSYNMPEYGGEFPAKKLETLMEWDDLILSPTTHEHLSELRAWLDHSACLLDEWQIQKHIKPGYRALFYGPPGTGKTLTASLLGKLSNRSVFRVDLSQLVSKYIGETEKNLENIFQQAELKDWILFFDEADALFGKRTRVSDAHDRYANQGTAYLLQRLEDCPNVVILASNLKSNLDEAFTRRFQSAIYFPMPEKRERYALWSRMISPVARLDENVDLEWIAEKHELAGGAIVNVVRYCSLMAIKEKTRNISLGHIMQGIQREYAKEGRTI